MRPHDMDYLLLNAGDKEFMAKFEQFYQLVLELNKASSVSKEQIEHMRHFVQVEMAPYNFRDYGNPAFDGVHTRADMKRPEFMARIEAMTKSETHQHTMQPSSMAVPA